jgi:hypothetical protein
MTFRIDFPLLHRVITNNLHEVSRIKVSARGVMGRLKLSISDVSRVPGCKHRIVSICQGGQAVFPVEALQGSTPEIFV